MLAEQIPIATKTGKWQDKSIEINRVFCDIALYVLLAPAFNWRAYFDIKSVFYMFACYFQQAK